MKLLGIETSCDETAAAVVQDGTLLLSNVINSQIDIHAIYGGVVPEVAARSHLEVMIPVVEKALSDAGCTWDDIDGIAVTYAPGLVGSLLIGTLAARTLALLKNKPLYPVHHVEGHVYANFIRSELVEGRTQMVDGEGQIDSSDSPTTNYPLPTTALSSAPNFPLLALIVSGGHSQLVLFRDHGDYELLGQTQDDAVGEAFDKVAKIIGLPYPGGPSIAQAALSGDAKAFDFPKAQLKCPAGCTHGMEDGRWKMEDGKSQAANSHRTNATSQTPNTTRQTCNYYSFSFSGLKTAVLRRVQAEVGESYDFPSHQLPQRVSDSLRADVAASFQRIACETLVDKTEKAFKNYQPASVVIAGGVAANQELRRILSERLPLTITYAPMNLCTDNAAMIASLGYYYAQHNQPTDPRNLEVIPSLSMTKTAWAGATNSI